MEMKRTVANGLNELNTESYLYGEDEGYRYRNDVKRKELLPRLTHFRSMQLIKWIFV